MIFHISSLRKFKPFKRRRWAPAARCEIRSACHWPSICVCCVNVAWFSMRLWIQTESERNKKQILHNRCDEIDIVLNFFPLSKVGVYSFVCWEKACKHKSSTGNRSLWTFSNFAILLIHFDLCGLFNFSIWVSFMRVELPDNSNLDSHSKSEWNEFVISFESLDDSQHLSSIGVPIGA